MKQHLDLGALEKAVACLKQGLIDAERLPDIRTVRDGVVQQFEFTVDLAWKLLQRYLKHVAQVEETAIRTKNDIFREAASRKIIPDAERWIAYYQARNETAHTYDIDRATAVYDKAKTLPDDADALIHALHDASGSAT